MTMNSPQEPAGREKLCGAIDLDDTQCKTLIPEEAEACDTCCEAIYDLMQGTQGTTMTHKQEPTEEVYPGPVIALLTIQAERDERWVAECRQFPHLHTLQEIKDFDDDVKAYRSHISALTALDTAVKGCGHWDIDDKGNDYTCGKDECLCCQCEANRDAAIRTLLGRTA